ncbi:DNA-directed DNA polymerase eta rad30 [Entophlyctis sp. JEL0112]|nr:DNA-directed DNA polymerase eta rad30 [Entophlyctis sp. JEL0112]
MLSPPSRVILHIDLDAFYAQVEQVRLDLPATVPIAVQQWQGLIAVNYPARACGLNKMSTVAEARQKCPHITLVHTASIGPGDSVPQYHAAPKYGTHKISLDVYRAASKRVMQVLARFAPPQAFERASVDEAYLDVSATVDTKVAAMLAAGAVELDADGVPVVNWSACEGVVAGIDKLSAPTTRGWSDLHLRVGADLCSEIRAAVMSELRYTCSAGVTRNKTLSKLCSAQNKPNNQTVLLDSCIDDFLRDMPFQKIRNLGGKLGGEIEEHFHAKTCGDVWKLPMQVLQAKLGESSAVWVHDIVRGICKEPVVQNQLQKSTGAHKNMRPPLQAMEDVWKWIDVLSCEIFLRLKEEYDTYSRWPKTFSISIRVEGQPATSKSAPMMPRLKVVSPESLSKYAISLLSNSTFIPCQSIGIGCSGFAKEDVRATSVLKFFHKVEPGLPPENTPGTSTIASSDAPSPSVEETESNNQKTGDHGKSSASHNFFGPKVSSQANEYCIECDQCGQLIAADDVSIAEHADYHVACALQKHDVEKRARPKKDAAESAGGKGSSKRRRGGSSKDILCYFKRQ